MKRTLVVALLFAAVSCGGSAEARGCIGCDVQPVQIAAPRNHVPAASLVYQGQFPLRTATPQVIEQTPARVARSEVSGGPSTNRFVNPWGCEARNAQEVYSGKGFYYWGKYQFDRDTWVRHGGNPNTYGSAPESEQDEVAARVTYDAWPNC